MTPVSAGVVFLRATHTSRRKIAPPTRPTTRLKIQPSDHGSHLAKPDAIRYPVTESHGIGDCLLSLSRAAPGRGFPVFRLPPERPKHPGRGG